MKKTQLVETLVKTGLVTEAVMAEFLKRAQAEGQNPIKLLLEEGKIDEHTFVQSAGLQLGIPPVYLEHIRIPSYIAKLISRDIAEKWFTIPITLKREGGKEVLYCAFLDPTDDEAMEEIKQLTGKPVKPVLSGLNDIHNAINRSFVTRHAKRSHDSAVSGVHEQPTVDKTPSAPPAPAASPLPPMQPAKQGPATMPPMQPSAQQGWSATPSGGHPTVRNTGTYSVEEALTPPPSQSGRIPQLRQPSQGVYRVPTGVYTAQQAQSSTGYVPPSGERYQRDGSSTDGPSTGVFPQPPQHTAPGDSQRRTPGVPPVAPRGQDYSTGAFRQEPGVPSAGYPNPRASSPGFPTVSRTPTQPPTNPAQSPTGPYNQRPTGTFGRVTPTGVPRADASNQYAAPPHASGQVPGRGSSAQIPQQQGRPPLRAPVDAYAEAWVTPEPARPAATPAPQAPTRTTPSGLNRAEVQGQIQDVLSVLEKPPEPGTFDRRSGRNVTAAHRQYEENWVGEAYAKRPTKNANDDSDNFAFDIPRAPAFKETPAQGHPNMTHQWIPTMGAQRSPSGGLAVPPPPAPRPSKPVKELSVDDTGAISLPQNPSTTDAIVTGNYRERKIKTQRIARGGGASTSSIPGRNASEIPTGANPLFEDFDRLLSGALSETKSRLEEELPANSDSVWTETKIRRQIDGAGETKPPLGGQTEKHRVIGYASPNGPGRSGSITVDEFRRKTTNAAMVIPTFPVEDGLSQRLSQEVFNELVQLVRLATGRNTVEDGNLIESFLQGRFASTQDPDMAALHRILAGRVRQMIQHGQISDPIVSTRFR